MKSKAYGLSILLTSFLFVLVTVFDSCGKQDEIVTPPITKSLATLTTTAISEITDATATSGGNITSDGNASVTERGVCWSTSETPTISDSKTSDGTGTGSYTSSLTGLTANTTYYVRAYATNSEGTAYGSQKEFTTISSSGTTGSFTDSRDGHTYATIEIGNQTWMAENLAYLPSVSPPSAGSTTSPYYYVHGYEGTDVNTAKATDNYATYGVLFNWPAAMAGASSSDSNPSGVQGVCPSGWHLPSDDEWTELSNYLINNGYGYGSSGDDIGKSMASSSGWISSSEAGDVGSNQSTNNSSGFNALPGGYRYSYGDFDEFLGYGGSWWSATGYNSAYAWYRYLYYDSGSLYHHNGGKEGGFSVRCVRDN